MKGLCDIASRVPCRAAGEGVPGAECAAVVTGDIPDNLNPGCGNFIRCINGVNTGSFECPPDTHFNPTAPAGCDLPANLTPPCTLPATIDNHYVKFAPVQKSKPVQVSSFRERLMSKLHLNH